MVLCSIRSETRWCSLNGFVLSICRPFQIIEGSQNRLLHHADILAALLHTLLHADDMGLLALLAPSVKGLRLLLKQCN